MSALSIYHWDFDRRAPSDQPFLTFSIAIFQWQPNASGKGLKKVNACRVHGYAMDPRSMYAKAQEICDRLNAEGASVGKLPKWLRKQYSVPKPIGLIVPRIDDDLPGSVVRSIRHTVMKRCLLPAGFVKGEAGTYVRRQGDQIHLIYFQGSKWGRQYTVNLGFHYAYLLPLFALKQTKLADYCVLDCGLTARIGDFTKPKGDQWFDYGIDRRQLEQTLEQNAERCLQVFIKEGKRLSRPRSLLVSKDAELSEKAIKPWWALDGMFAPLLAFHLGRRKAAIRELERLEGETQGALKQRLKRLIAMSRSE